MRPVPVVLALLCAWRTASAHQTSVKYVDLRVGARDEVDVTIKFAPSDVTEAMGLPADATPPIADAVAHPAVPAYVSKWVAFPRCLLQDPARAAAVDARFIAVTFRMTCSTTRELRADFTPFFAIDRRHEAIVLYTSPHLDPVQTIVRASEPHIVLGAGEASVLAWLRTGMDHIYGGLDHVLFVIALLLVVMLYPGIDKTTWHLRALSPTLRSTAVVITAFTVGHSVTLIAAALDLIVVPSAVVEAVIALSIAYTAAEDVIRPAVRWRFWLAFGFGLIHGLGFASMLIELLPPTDIIVPMLCFNLGVEIGQLSIVAVALPLLWLVARNIGASRYRRYVLPALAAPIFFVGMAMVVDRVM